MRALLACLLATLPVGCDDSMTVDTDLVGLGPIEVEITRDPYVLDVKVRYAGRNGEPCRVLGPDLAGRIDDVQLEPWPGGVVEQCWSTDSYNPCDPKPSTCEPPRFTTFPIPQGKQGDLSIEDASRFVRCDLGDLLVDRNVVRGDAEGWDVDAGQTITVRWSHADDLVDAAIEVAIVEQIPWTPLPFTRVDDTLTIDLPRGLARGPHRLRVAAYVDRSLPVGSQAKGSCGLSPSRLRLWHDVRTTLTVR